MWCFLVFYSSLKKWQTAKPGVWRAKQHSKVVAVMCYPRNSGHCFLNFTIHLILFSMLSTALFLHSSLLHPSHYSVDLDFSLTYSSQGRIRELNPVVDLWSKGSGRAAPQRVFRLFGFSIIKIKGLEHILLDF